MSDSDKTSFATTGSGKSEAEVAFELVSKLKGQGVWGERNITPILDMYAECLDAVRGLRAYPGQNRVDTEVTSAKKQSSQQVQPQQPAQTPVAQPAPQAQAAPQAKAAPQTQPTQQAQAAPHQPAQQSVQGQQQILQQVFQTG